MHCKSCIQKRSFTAFKLCLLFICISLLASACGSAAEPQTTTAPSEAPVAASGIENGQQDTPQDRTAPQQPEQTGVVYFLREWGYYNTAGEWVEAPEYSCMYTNLLRAAPGERFNYTGLGVASAASVIWYDSEYNILSCEQHGNWPTPKAVIVTAPEQAAFVRFSSFYKSCKPITLEVSYTKKVPADESPLNGKKIVYDGDSICFGTGYAGGYAKMIAELTGSDYENYAVGGARLITQLEGASYHSIVDNLPNLPADGDLYCFEGGINDYWTNGVALGTYDNSFDGELDTTTVCGALETIFRYSLEHFPGKPICFVIVHKIQSTAYQANSAGNTFQDYHDAMVGICQKYSIPYYDAYYESGLNGWNETQNRLFLTGNPEGYPDGCHPNEEGYRIYYVPQLISLFERIIPPDPAE